MKLTLEEIQEDIFEIEIYCKETDKYWEDLIRKEIQKRTKYYHSRWQVKNIDST